MRACLACWCRAGPWSGRCPRSAMPTCGCVRCRRARRLRWCWAWRCSAAGAMTVCRPGRCRIFLAARRHLDSTSGQWHMGGVLGHDRHHRPRLHRAVLELVGHDPRPGRRADGSQAEPVPSPLLCRIRSGWGRRSLRTFRGDDGGLDESADVWGVVEAVDEGGQDAGLFCAGAAGGVGGVFGVDLASLVADGPATRRADHERQWRRYRRTGPAPGVRGRGRPPPRHPTLSPPTDPGSPGK